MPSFSKVVRNSRRNHCSCSRRIFREVITHQSNVLAPAVFAPTDVLPILPCWASLHQLRDNSGFTAALRAWSRAKVWHSCGARVHRCQQQPQCPLQRALLEGQSPGKGNMWELLCALNFSKNKVLRYCLKKSENWGKILLISIVFVLETENIFYEMSCIFTVFPPFHHVTHRT